MKTNTYFYMIWINGDSDDSLDWFTVVPTRTEANRIGRELAAERGWSFKYLSAKSGLEPYEFDGKNTIVVHQTDHYYHGA